MVGNWKLQGGLCVLGGILLVMALGVKAQGAQEDFEGDTFNNTAEASDNNPVGFYTYTDTQTACNAEPTAFHGVVTPGLDATNQRFRLDTNDPGSCTATFSFPDLGGVGNMSWWHRSQYNVASAGARDPYWLRDAENDAIMKLQITRRVAGDCGGVADCYNVVNVRIDPVGSTTIVNHAVAAERMFGEIFIQVTYDDVARTMDFLVQGEDAVGDPVTVTRTGVPYSDVDAGTATNLFLGDTSNYMPGFNFDQWLINGGAPEEEAPLEPAEFDAGLAALLISIGIVTPESQMFFVMGLVGVLLVGLAAALRWVSPGRLKNSILVGVACLVVVFGALFQYLETWMVVVPIVVGAFTAFGGAKVVQNTYFEVRKGLASLAGSVDLRPKARRGGKTLTSSASAGAPSASPAPESPGPAPESPAGEDA